ncbi:MAG: hypothetical protein Q8O67_12085 [Deltaproteobacteria bacterium]|nr:hypothetical protein [Deltaproteobacteria bacterium]
MRLAIVSLQRADKPGVWNVAVARGEKRTKLTDSRLYGPFSLEEAEKAFASVTGGLASEGYLSSGLAELLQIVATSKSPSDRARAEEKLGWRAHLLVGTKAVDVLLARADKPKDDISSVIIALGRAGDRKAIPAVRLEAERKLLSRRRAGVEALRMLGDVDGLAAARLRALERLPDNVRAKLLALDEQQTVAVDVVKELLLACDEKERGGACDSLYELATPLAVGAARAALLASDVSKPWIWRYTKSVIKRAILRTDGETLGVLIHRVEIRGRTTTGVSVKLKSGLDGEVRSTTVFSRKTVIYTRRAVWRFLRGLAKWRPADYALVAAWCVVPYSDEDDVKPVKRLPSVGTSYLLSRVLMGASKRFVVDDRRLRLLWKGPKPQNPTPGVREDAYAHLWDLPTSTPAFHVLLGRARHRVAVNFSVDAVARNPAILASASTQDLARMLGSPDDRLGDLAFNALRSRFVAEKPDVDAILQLGSIEHERARTLAGLWLTSSAHVWSRDVDAVVRLVGGSPAVREAATRLLLLALPHASPALRASLAERLLAIVDAAEPVEGAFSAWGELASVLGPELATRCTPALAMRLVERHDAGAVVAAVVFRGLADPLALLGAAAVTRLAASSKAAQRSIAIAALSTSSAAFREQLTLTLSLAEGEWDDVRAACCEVIAGLDPKALDLPRWMAILDATHPAVQDVGKKLLGRRLVDEDTVGALDVHELLGRLAQHPHRNIRAFVVDLAVERLKPGYVRLAKLESLARSALFDVRPDRALRRRLIAFLQLRGLQDEAQAELVCGLLADVIRSRTHEVRDDAAAAIAVLASTWSELQLPSHVIVERTSVGA